MNTDEKILALCQEGGKETEAFNFIVDEYSERLYWHIRRMIGSHEDTNDILQETFIKIWKNISKFRGDSKVYSWLYRIATNEALNFLRKKKLESFLSLDNYEGIVEENLKGDSYFDGDKAVEALNNAVLKLPPKQRAVFNLKYFEEKKYTEISEILGGSIGSLKASYHHAYTKITKSLTDTD
ncbi:MAG: RNA polymerase sigma factor [Bacteroidales bacterium]